MNESPDSLNAALPAGATDQPRFPAATFLGAIAMVVIGFLSIVVYLLFFGWSHNFNSRRGETWLWAAVVLHASAGFLFLWAALSAGDIPSQQRSRFVRAGIIVSYLLAATLLVFSAWTVIEILDLWAALGL